MSGAVNDGERAVLTSELESMRSEFTSGLSSVRDQVAHLREELAGDRAAAATLWAVHDQAHRYFTDEDIPHRVEQLEAWRIEMVTLGRFVKLTFGASVVGALLAFVSLWETIQHAMGTR